MEYWGTVIRRGGGEEGLTEGMLWKCMNEYGEVAILSDQFGEKLYPSDTVGSLPPHGWELA